MLSLILGNQFKWPWMAEFGEWISGENGLRFFVITGTCLLIGFVFALFPKRIAWGGLLVTLGVGTLIATIKTPQLFENPVLIMLSQLFWLGSLWLGGMILWNGFPPIKENPWPWILSTVGLGCVFKGVSTNYEAGEFWTGSIALALLAVSLLMSLFLGNEETPKRDRS